MYDVTKRIKSIALSDMNSLYVILTLKWSEGYITLIFLSIKVLKDWHPHNSVIPSDQKNEPDEYMAFGSDVGKVL